MPRTFLISDTHFGHEGIIKLCNRPFSSVDEMDHTMVKNWNSVVTDEDTIYHLGDFSWYKDFHKNKEIFEELKRKKILVLGNHDQYVQGLGWKEVIPYLKLKYKAKKCILFHYPIEEWDGYWNGSYSFYGHVHNNNPGFLKNLKNRHNVSVELINYTPVDIETFLGA